MWEMSGRVVLVTGATSGLGYETAKQLGRAGATVLVHGRDGSRARRVAQEVGGAGRAVVADLGSLAGVRALAEQVREAAPEGLNVLVNNAGTGFPHRELSPEGVEKTIAVNHLAVAALTLELRQELKLGAESSGAASRVVNVSSTMERRGDPGLVDWSYPAGFSQFQAYRDAKLLNLAYTYALARRLEGVEVNAADPGPVATSFGRNAGGLFRVVQVLGRPLLAKPERAARTAVRLASDPELVGHTGGYYAREQLTLSSAGSRDERFQERVYAQTEAIIAAKGDRARR